MRDYILGSNNFNREIKRDNSSYNDIHNYRMKSKRIIRSHYRDIFFKKITISLLIVLSLSFIFGFYMLRKPYARQIKNTNKYFTSIVIKDGDTLDKIAKRYNNDEVQSDKEYTKYVMELNHQLDTKLIKGMNIIIPYYKYED